MVSIGKTELTEVLQDALETIADFEAETDSPKTPIRKRLEEMIQRLESQTIVKINVWD